MFLVGAAADFVVRQGVSSADLLFRLNAETTACVC